MHGSGGHVWKGGMHGRGGMCGEDMRGRGYAWQGGIHGRRACVAGGVHGRRNSHCSGQYASYWNAFLFETFSNLGYI